MRNTYFYDIDKASDALNTSNYNSLDFANVRTDHTVDRISLIQQVHFQINSDISNELD